MSKRLAVLPLFLLLVIMPIRSHAATTTELQAQIQALIAQIAALQNQINGSGGGGTGVVTTSNACVSITHNLSLNTTDTASGGDVSRLQQFLANQGSSIYPEARVTGYFGLATERAVQRWQSAHAVVSGGDANSTGYGYIGPRSRNALACTVPTNIYTPPVTTTTTNVVSGLIDSNSLYSISSHPVITGSASNVHSVSIAIRGFQGGSANVVNGRWVITIGDALPAGTYVLQLSDDDNGTVLNSRTLTVTGTTATSPNLPSCTVSVTTTRGTETFSNQGSTNVSDRIMVWNDEPLTITWSSSNASQAYDYTGNLMNPNGTVVIQHPQAQNYQFQFNSTAGIVDCTVIAYPVSASFDQSTLSSSSPTPTISGAATGVNTVEVLVRKGTFSTTRLYDATVPVVNGRWSTTLTPALTSGVYTIDLYGPSDLKLNYIVTGTLALNTGTASAAGTCSAGIVPSHANINQLFSLNWTSSGVANVSPTFAVGPSLYTTTHSGTSGIILNSPSGSQQFFDSVPETMSFALGSGGIAGGPFSQLCSASIALTDDGTNAGNTKIDSHSLYPSDNNNFTISGTTNEPDGTVIYVAVVPATYSGARDSTSINGSYVRAGTAVASGGTWTVSFAGGYSETQYTALVYIPSISRSLVTSGLLYFTDKG